MKLCGFHQFYMSSALDRDGRLPRLTRRHLQGCAACRSVWNRLNGLHGLLAEQGGQIRVQAERSPLNRLRPVLVALPERKESRLPRSLATRRWRPWVAMAAASLALVIGIRWLRPLAKTPDSVDRIALSDVRNRIDSVRQNLAQASLEDPLERELQGLIGSARSAAGYLRSKVKKATGLDGENGG